MDSTLTLFTIPVKNFRKFVSPFHEARVPTTLYACYVQICDLPEAFSQFILYEEMQMLNRQTEQQVLAWMQDGTPYLHLRVRPITVTASQVVFDNRKGKVRVELSDRTKHGVVAGLHALRAILGNRDQCNNNQYLELHFLESMPSEALDEFVYAQNL